MRQQERCCYGEVVDMLGTHAQTAKKTAKEAQQEKRTEP